MIEVTNNMINKLSDSIKEEIKFYLKDDTLSHRFFISNIINSTGTDESIVNFFDISNDFLNTLRIEIKELNEDISFMDR